MQFSKNYIDITSNANITFPVAYKNWVTLIGVGFVIAPVGRQGVILYLTGFRSTTDGEAVATNSWLSIGV